MSRRISRKHLLNVLFQYSFLTDSDIDEVKESYFYNMVNDVEPIEDDDINSKCDKKFFEKEILGIYENLSKIDETIGSLSKGWDISRINKVDLSILRIAVYEILFSEVPDKVAINEAVELAKIYGTDKSSSFINGILGKVVKNKEISD